MSVGGPGPFGSSLSNTVAAEDTLNWDTSGNFAGNTGAKSTQNYLSTDGLGGCYSEKLTSEAGVLTAAASGSGCHPW